MRERCGASPKPIKTMINFERTKVKTLLDIGHKIYIIGAIEHHLSNILVKEIKLE